LRTEVEGSARLRISFAEEVNHEARCRRYVAWNGSHRFLCVRVDSGPRKFGRACNNIRKNLGGISYERKETIAVSPKCTNRFRSYQLHRTRHGAGCAIRAWRFVERLSLAPPVRGFVEYPSLHSLDLLAHGDTEIAPDQDVSVTANAKMLKEFSMP